MYTRPNKIGLEVPYTSSGLAGHPLALLASMLATRIEVELGVRPTLPSGKIEGHEICKIRGFLDGLRVSCDV